VPAAAADADAELTPLAIRPATAVSTAVLVRMAELRIFTVLLRCLPAGVSAARRDVHRNARPGSAPAGGHGVGNVSAAPPVAAGWAVVEPFGAW
jgi:hypothetical protein